MGSDPCAFCRIVSGQQPANIRYDGEDILVFDNQLDWAPVMLLLIPKQHMTQRELWTSADLTSNRASSTESGIFARLSALAVEMGERYCPNGFRLLSNFGSDAMQSQSHGHLHLIGGTPLGRYVEQ